MDKLSLETNIGNGVISQELLFNQNGHIKRMSRWVINTREENIKNALIKIGWTPPVKGKTK